MVVMIAIDHTSEYFLVSRMLLNNIARKGNIIANLNISLLMVSLAAGFVICQLFHSVINFFCFKW